MIAFRRATRDDFALLAAWLDEPHNRRWWNHETSPAALERDFGPSVDGLDPSQDWLALDESGAPFGLVQRQPWDAYPDEVASLSPLLDLGAGDYQIDYLIGEASRTGRGLGTAMISAMCHIIFAELSASRIVVPVVIGNRRSWRALERTGFSRVGTVDLPPDNPIDPPAHVVYELRR